MSICKNTHFIVLLIVFVVLVPAYTLAAEESITLTTYYPSPYGVYNEMQLYPHNDPVGSCSSGRDEGLMYYDRDEHTLKVCMCKNPPACSVYGWLPSSGYWAASPSNSNNIYNTNSGNVGIGTNDPQLPLHLKAARDGWLMALEGPADKFTAYGLTSDFITGWGMGMWGKSTAAPTTEDFGVGYYDGAGWNIPFVIDKSAGNVGIGTTAPSATLDIYHIKSPTTMGHVWFGGDNPIYSDMSFDGASDGLFVFTNTGIAAGGTAFYSSATGKVPLAMTNSGDVGIGLPSGSSPTQRLDVNGQLRIRGGSPAPGYVLTSEDASGAASWKPSSGAIKSASGMLSLPPKDPLTNDPRTINVSFTPVGAICSPARDTYTSGWSHTWCFANSIFLGSNSVTFNSMGCHRPVGSETCEINYMIIGY